MFIICNVGGFGWAKSYLHHNYKLEFLTLATRTTETGLSVNVAELHFCCPDVTGSTEMRLSNVGAKPGLVSVFMKDEAK